MVLNLRSYGQLDNSSNLTTKTNMVFRSVHGPRGQSREPDTWLNSALEELAEPLMVHETESDFDGDEDQRL